MSKVLKVLKTRSSCRHFTNEEVSKEDIEKIVEAGTYAPSGMNRQSPIIIAVTDKKVRDELSRINASFMNYDGDPFYGGPVVLIVLADKSVPTYLYDGSLVMGNMLNATESLGLGSIWIHRAKETFESEYGKKLLKSLGIEGDYEGIGNCVIGHKGEPSNSNKKIKDNYIYYVG